MLNLDVKQNKKFNEIIHFTKTITIWELQSIRKLKAVQLSVWIVFLIQNLEKGNMNNYVPWTHQRQFQT